MLLHCSQVAQGGCGCPIPAGIQGQAGCGSGQPGLLVGDPAHSRGLELDEHCGPLQPRPVNSFVIIAALTCVILCYKKREVGDFFIIGQMQHPRAMCSCDSIAPFFPCCGR